MHLHICSTFIFLLLEQKRGKALPRPPLRPHQVPREGGTGKRRGHLRPQASGDGRRSHFLSQTDRGAKGALNGEGRRPQIRALSWQRGCKVAPQTQGPVKSSRLFRLHQDREQPRPQAYRKAGPSPAAGAQAGSLRQAEASWDGGRTPLLGRASLSLSMEPSIESSHSASTVHIRSRDTPRCRKRRAEPEEPPVRKSTLANRRRGWAGSTWWAWQVPSPWDGPAGPAPSGSRKLTWDLGI